MFFFFFQVSIPVKDNNLSISLSAIMDHYVSLSTYKSYYTLYYFISIYYSLQLFTCMCNNMCNILDVTEQDIKTALKVLLVWSFVCLEFFNGKI